MGVPSPRTPVRIARGTKSVLETNKGALEEGEICYATDENLCYVKEGSNLESITKAYLDEDDMSSNSATQAPTQQSVKAYADARLPLAGGTLTGTLTGTVGTFSGQVTADDFAIAAGSSNEGYEINDGGTNWLSLYYSSSANRNILTSHTKPLQIESDQAVYLGHDDEVSLYSVKNGSVKLYYNDQPKFETTSTGIHIEGSIALEGATSNDYETTLTVTDPTADRTITFPNATGTVALGVIGTDIQAYDADTAKLDVDQAWTGAQRGTIADTPAMTGDITIDMAASNNYKATLTANAAFKNPTNQVAGQSGSLFITQDGTGSRTASWEANWKWVGGTAPTLSTAAASVDRIDYIILASGTIHAVASLDVK